MNSDPSAGVQQELRAEPNDPWSAADSCWDGIDDPDRHLPPDPADDLGSDDDFLSAHMMEYFAQLPEVTNDGPTPPPTDEEFAADVLERGADEAVSIGGWRPSPVRALPPRRVHSRSTRASPGNRSTRAQRRADSTGPTVQAI